ncbi:MAG: hypothetical protein V1888_02405 [archaeon]
MRLNFVWLFLIVFCFGFVCGADEWGNIGDIGNVEIESYTPNTTPNQITINNDVSDVQVVDDVPVVKVVSESSEGGEFYTMNFYIALVIVVLFLIVLGVFIWFWIRGFKNKWE